MANLTTTESIQLSDHLTNLDLVKYNPSAIQSYILNQLSYVSGGKVNIVDPTNPFVFLLEASCVNTAAAVNHNRQSLRKQYASLSQTTDELYHHLSDKDLIDRFATPSATEVTFLIQYETLLGQMVRDDTEGCIKATIARDTVITASTYSFTLQYPIVIRYFDNSVLQIAYSTEIISPLQELSTNIIEYDIRKDTSNLRWLRFKVPMSQFVITSNNYNVQASQYFKQTIEFTDQYYYCRAFYKNTDGDWTEMSTTHTDQVYDPYTPTAVLKVYDTEVVVYIPPVYVNTNQITGEVRFDIYTTQGDLTIDMSNFKVTEFSTVFRSIDEERDSDEYTAVMSNVSYLAYSDSVATGGSDALSFTELRERHIMNAIGYPNLPITNVQVPASIDRKGFDVIKNVDVVTNRIFLATKNLPSPVDTSLITPANLTIETFTTSLSVLSGYSEIYTNDNRYTIPSSMLYTYDNGKVNIFTKSELSVLQNKPLSDIVDTVNNTKFLYSPFYYVLDNTKDEFKMRAYHLDQPIVSGLNFISQNITADLTVNTSSYTISKTDTGFRLTVFVTSDSYYKKLADKYVSAQLAFIPEGESKYVYLNGYIAGTDSSGERIFMFDIETSYDIDSNDLLYLTNFKMFSTNAVTIPTVLSNTFNILYTTSSRPLDYIADEAQSIIGDFLLDDDSIVITRESIDILFGYSLSSLWKNTRTVIDSDGYQKYTENVPLTYANDVYEVYEGTDSIMKVNVDGTISYNLIHAKGDTVYSEAGDIVYKYLKGDVVLDENDQPVPIADEYLTRYLDLLFVDGAYFFATDQNYQDYRDEIASVINTWVVSSLASIDQKLLEQTEIYYYPKKSHGTVEVTTEIDTTTVIDASQTIDVIYYVQKSVYNDDRIREKIEQNTIALINTLIQGSTVSKSDMIEQLKTLFDEMIIAVEVSGLGGSANNYPTVTLVDSSQRLSIGKKLVVQADDTTIVKETINVSFIAYLDN